MLATDPARLALVLDGLLGVRHSPLHIVHRVFHVVLDPVNHLPLQARGRQSSRGLPLQGGGSEDYPEWREGSGLEEAWLQCLTCDPRARRPGRAHRLLGQLPPLPTEQPSGVGISHAVSAKGGDHAENTQLGP